MGEFYRHKKGGIYRVLHEARHSETDEILIVYQAMYGNKEIWARPKKMFFGEGRFTKITKEEAISANCYIAKQKYNFPDIEFSPETKNLIDPNREFSIPVKSMITLLSKRGLVDKESFNHLKNEDDLESEIIKKINSYSGDKEIMHRIYILLFNH